MPIWEPSRTLESDMPMAYALDLEEPLTPPAAPHLPVLVEETVELLGVQDGSTVVDATLGPGGHATVLLDRIGPGGRLIGLDRDQAALALARTRLARCGDRLGSLHGEQRDIASLLRGTVVDAVLADLGISSAQLDEPARGFAFSADGPLDMRMDRESADTTAADLVASLSLPE